MNEPHTVLIPLTPAQTLPPLSRPSVPRSPAFDAPLPSSTLAHHAFIVHAASTSSIVASRHSTRGAGGCAAKQQIWFERTTFDR